MSGCASSEHDFQLTGFPNPLLFCRRCGQAKGAEASKPFIEALYLLRQLLDNEKPEHEHPESCECSWCNAERFYEQTNSWMQGP